MKDKEFIISLEKVKMNIIRFWWIVVVALVVGVVCAQFVPEAEAEDTETVTTYTSTIRIYASYEEDAPETVYLNQNASAAGNYNELFYSNAVRELANEKLAAEGVAGITSSDSMWSYPVNDNIVVLSTSLNNDTDRMQAVSDALAEAIIEYGMEHFPYTYAEILEPTFFNTSVEIAADDSSSTFQVNGTFVIILAVCIGIFIICMIIAFDRKIYIREEMPDELTYIGEMKNDAQIDVTAATINSIVDESGYKSLCITTPAKAYDMTTIEKLKGLIKCENTEVAAGMETEAATLPTLTNADGVVVVVKCGKDDMRTAYKMADRLKLTKVNVIGYVLI